MCMYARMGSCVSISTYVHIYLFIRVECPEDELRMFSLVHEVLKSATIRR